jgi:hypothetical protein
LAKTVRAVHFGYVDLFAVQSIEILPNWSQVLAVSTPGRIKLDEPRFFRSHRHFIIDLTHDDFTKRLLVEMDWLIRACFWGDNCGVGSQHLGDERAAR